MTMKLTITEIKKIAGDVKAALDMQGLSAASAARASGIHHSRLSRILNGRFATLNPTVVQICTYLGVAQPSVFQSDGATRIAASALRVWDGTTEDVEVVVRLFDQLADMRQRSPGGGKAARNF